MAHVVVDAFTESVEPLLGILPCGRSEGFRHIGPAGTATAGLTDQGELGPLELSDAQGDARELIEGVSAVGVRGHH